MLPDLAALPTPNLVIDVNKANYPSHLSNFHPPSYLIFKIFTMIFLKVSRNFFVTTKTLINKNAHPALLIIVSNCMCVKQIMDQIRNSLNFIN